MKAPALILTIFMAAAVAAGQVLTAKDDTSAELEHQINTLNNDLEALN